MGKAVKTQQNQHVSIETIEQEVIDSIQWSEKTCRLKDLRPFEQNPRRITKEQFEKLKTSILQDGYHSRIKTDGRGRIAGGHQRLRALLELGFSEVPVLVPNRPLSDIEFMRVMVRDNHNNGLFDMDALANMFDLEDLRGFGLHDVTSIAPEGEGDKPPRSMVCCPNCGESFPVKGNKA